MQHNLPNACAFHQMRAFAFGPNACVRIWPLLVSLTKCAAHLGKCTAQLAKRCAFGQMPRVSSIGQMCSAFRQMRRLVKCAGHLKNIHLYSSKHKTVKLKLTLTLTLTDTGGAVLTLMLGYRRLRNYKLKLTSLQRCFHR